MSLMGKQPIAMNFGGTAVRPAGQTASGFLVRQAVQAVLIAAISVGLLWIVWIYGNGLRDPRYLDGWILAGGMGLQLGFHIAIKTGSLSPKSALRWRKIHVFVGYLLIAAFVSHSDFSLPDTGFEWALCIGFVLVTVTGIFGTYLSWSLKAKGRIDEGVSYDRIPALRAELAREVHAIAAETDPGAAQLALPGLPHDAWIMDLYISHLRDFFQGPRNLTFHLIGSQAPVKRLIEEIDNLSRYSDQQSRERLVTIKNLVMQKDRLDFARVYLSLTRLWLLIHVPVTYALIIMTVLHVLIVYAFSSGAW
jgi:hypothetical protein